MGVSVITCTMRDSCIDNVFENYKRQKYVDKELIIVLTKKEMEADRWRVEAAQYKDVYVYPVTDSRSLGSWLNFAVGKAKYELIANFEDDDFYSSNYIIDSLKIMRQTHADVIGKTSVYLYMPDRKALMIFNPGNEQQYVNDQIGIGKEYLQGGTLLFKRCVKNKISFRNQLRELDRLFCKDCVKAGYRVYSAGKENFVYIRSDTKGSHTWQVSNDLIMNVSQLVAYTDDFRTFVK